MADSRVEEFPSKERGQPGRAPAWTGGNLAGVVLRGRPATEVAAAVAATVAAALELAAALVGAALVGAALVGAALVGAALAATLAPTNGAGGNALLEALDAETILLHVAGFHCLLLRCEDE